MNVSKGQYEQNPLAWGTALASSRYEKFDVAFWPGDRTGGYADDLPARLNSKPRRYFATYTLVHRGVANDPALADIRPSCFELWLDKGDKPSIVGGESQRPFEDLGKAYEAGIANNYADGLGNVGGSEYAGTRALMHDHPIILAQLPGELVGAAVDGVDPRCPTGQQDVGEAACGATDIHRNGAGHVDAELRKRVIELESPPRNPGVIASAHVDRRVRAELLAGLVDLAVADEDEARHDQRLRARPALGQAAVDDQLVGAGFHGHERSK